MQSITYYLMNLVIREMSHESKKGGLDRTLSFCNFILKFKLKSEIFNEKYVDEQQNVFLYHNEGFRYFQKIRWS